MHVIKIQIINPKIKMLEIPKSLISFKLITTLGNSCTLPVAKLLLTEVF